MDFAIGRVRNPRNRLNVLQPVVFEIPGSNFEGYRRETELDRSAVNCQRSNNAVQLDPAEANNSRHGEWITAGNIIVCRMVGSIVVGQPDGSGRYAV
jgi:hypothetical protein